MEKEVRFSIAQIEVTPGHPDVNVEKILNETERAKERKIDVILFPEMAVPGYLLGDEWENDGFIHDLMEWNQKILTASRGIAIVWGNVHADFTEKGEDGRIRKYNAAHIAQNGEWVNNGVFNGHTFKTLMPKYREFDDERHFYSMQKLAMEKKTTLEKLLKPFPIKIKGGTFWMGAILCEDMWCMDYAVNPTHILVKNGADVIVNISCSPWTWRKNDKRHRVVENLLKKDPVYFIYGNNVGTQNNGKNIFLFDGGSTVYNPDGTIALSTKPYEEKVYDVVVGEKGKNIIPRPELSDSKDVEELYNGIIYGIKRFFESRPNKRAVVGISGGIDSAVVASLLTQSLGAENVYGVNMPSRFNADITKNSAALLSQNLGINYTIFPIQDAVDLTVSGLKKIEFNNPKGEITKLSITGPVIENIQARDRGSRVLAGISGGLEAVFTNNGNKTEAALGYCTLYGDVDGALAPIADIYKWQVYELAKYINKRNGKDIIPQSIINVVPSAELSEEQDVTKGKGDPINYPYHDKLVRAFVEFRLDPEDVLRLYKDDKLEKTLKIEDGLVKKYFPTTKEFINDLEQKWRLYKTNYFKRIQAPPIIAVSKRAFGFDLRESQNGVYFTKRYLEMKKKLIP